MFVIRGLSTGFNSESLVSQFFGSSSICDSIRLVNGSNFDEMNLGDIPTRSGGQSDSTQSRSGPLDRPALNIAGTELYLLNELNPIAGIL